MLSIIEFRDALARMGAVPEWITTDCPSLVTIVWFGTAREFECTADGAKEAAVWYAEIEMALDDVTVH